MIADNTGEGEVKGASAKAPGPCTIVIFGGTGDLTKRLLVPAILNLQNAKLLPQNFSMVGVSRSGESDEAFRGELDEFMQDLYKTRKADLSPGSQTGQSWKSILDRVHYFAGDFDEAETYTGLKTKLEEVDGKYQTGGNVLFYLAVAPAYFSKIIKRLGEAGLTKEDKGWRRVIVEKPFGHDLESARALNKEHLVPTMTGRYRKGDIRHCFADITAAREVLGYRPQYPLETALGSLVEWLEEQESTVPADRVEQAHAELASRGLTV